MFMRLITCVVLLSAGALWGQGGPGPSGSGSGGGSTAKQVSLFIPNESAPPGGLVQMKFMVTEPTPISSGGPIVKYDATTFDAVLGIELFCPTGDLNGVALIDGPVVATRYITSSGAQGTDYPIMTMALHVRPDAVPGASTQFSLDSSSTWLLGLLGPATLKPMPPATVSVGGSISITNVVPGGGILPTGAVVSIRGMGFQPKTQVQLNAIKFSSIQMISPEEIQFTLAQDTNMTGQKIQVVNPDGSQDTYFSYLRGIPLGQSNQPLLADAVPIFSSMTYTMAVFNPVMPASSPQFTGIAMQNSGLTDVPVNVSLYSSSNVLLGSSTLTLPSGNRLMREISELASGAAPTSGSYVVVTADSPIQVFGFVGDNSAGTVTPFTAVLTHP
jgi:hypothetical protein